MEKSYQIPILTEFWAAWCQPCQTLMPLLQQLAEDYKGKFWLAKVNADEEQTLALQYGVRSLPTLKLFRNGKVADELIGVQPKSVIRAIIDRHIISEAELLLNQHDLLGGRNKVLIYYIRLPIQIQKITVSPWP